MAFLPFASSSRGLFGAPPSHQSYGLEAREPSSWDRLHYERDPYYGGSMYTPSRAAVHDHHAQRRAQQQRDAAANYERRLAAEQAQREHAARVHRQRLMEHQRMLQRQRQQKLHAAQQQQQQQQKQERLRALQRARHRQAENEREAERYERAFQQASSRQRRPGGLEQRSPPPAASASSRAPICATRLNRRVLRDGRIEEIFLRKTESGPEIVRRRYDPRTRTWETAAPEPVSPSFVRRVEAAQQLQQPESEPESESNSDSESDSDSHSSSSSDSEAFHHHPSSCRAGSPQPSRCSRSPRSAACATPTASRPEASHSPTRFADARTNGSSRPPLRASSLVEIRDLAMDGNDSDDSDVEPQPTHVDRSPLLKDQWDNLDDVWDVQL